jgi:1,2-phenylacetyl-CoA epoxidase catalytic subunit
MKNATRFGPWVLQTNRTLLHEAMDYEVDLDEARTSAEVLDWICQVARKDWADDVTIAWLVRALDGVLNLQSTMCSFGREKGPVDVKSVVARYFA